MTKSNEFDAAAIGQRRSFLRRIAGAGAATLGAGLLAACGGGGEDSEAAADGREGALTRTIGNCSSKSGAVVDAAGNAIAYIDFINDGSHISVQVLGPADETCTLGKMSLWIGTDLTTLPVDAAGQPRYADLPHQADASGSALRVYEFLIPTSALDLDAGALACGSEPVNVYVVGQVTTACAVGTVQGWGGTNSNGAHNFAIFELCCTETPVVLDGCETAFAKGTHTFSFETKRCQGRSRHARRRGRHQTTTQAQRWGWAIKLQAPGTTRYDIYAGAGRNDTSAGQRVGTLSVAWDGAQASVTYSMFSGVTMKEAHLYARDHQPTKLAPGSYGNTAYFNTPVAAHTFDVPLADSNGDGVWLIAHAVVCQA